MFSTHRKTTHVGALDLTRKLVNIRLYDYSDQVIKQEFADIDYKLIVIFIKELSEKILKARLINSGVIDAFKAAKLQSSKIIDNLASTNETEVAYYAAQLVQYYTMTCDIHFMPNSDFQSFYHFLSTHTNKLGDTSNNLFVSEYKLIIIYNELTLLIDSFIQLDEAEKRSEIDMRLKYLELISQHLELLGQRIEQETLEAPDNVFICYLSFIHQYTLAKLIEYRYIMQKNSLSKEMKLKLSDSQEFYLNAAKEILDKIDGLNQFSAEHGIAYGKGMEFSLGETLFSKLPEPNIEEFRKHILSLLSK